MKKNERILIVGGNGFIGSHIVSHALSLGLDVTNISLKRNNIVNNSNLTNVIADVSDIESLQSSLENFNFKYVINCSGYIEHDLFCIDGKRIIDTHYLGVVNLINLLNRDILKSFINIGSSDEYGNSCAPQLEFLRESPISPYSFAKVAATHFLQMLHRTEKFPSTTIRLYLVYGPGQSNERFLPQIITGCLEKRSFPTTYGEQLRDFCFVDDIVEAIFFAMKKKKANGEVINVASGSPVTIRSVVELVRKLIGYGKPQFGEIKYREGENMKLYADVNKAKELLNWAPKIQLEEGLGKTIDWVKYYYEK